MKECINTLVVVYGVAISVFGAVMLCSTGKKSYRLLSKYKYMKVNAISAAIPSLFLIVFGALIATLPLTLPLLTKKETPAPASINVTLQDNAHCKTPPKKPFKNKVILLVPIGKDGKPATVALSLLVDTAKSFCSAKQSPKVIIASSVQDSCEKNEANKAAKYVVELLANNGIKNCEIDHKTAVKVEQAGSCLCVTIQGRDK